MVNLGIGTIVSPWPPITIAFISFTGTPNSSDKNNLNLELSKMPAIPITLFAGRPENFWNAITITSSGLVIHITKAFGAFFLIPIATCLIIFKLIPRRSSLLIPGFLGTPAVIIITSEFLISSYLSVPENLTLKPSTDDDWAISSAFPFAIPLAISKSTTSLAISLVPIKWAKVPPIWPDPIKEIFFFMLCISFIDNSKLFNKNLDCLIYLSSVSLEQIVISSDIYDPLK